MKRLFHWFFLLLFISCTEKYIKVSEMRHGDVVSIIQGDSYCIAKVLDINNTGKDSSISIYLYKQKYKSRPGLSDYEALIAGSDTETWGNINWDIQGFEGMRPQVFTYKDVTIEEIENDTTMTNIIKIIGQSSALQPIGE